MSTWKVLGFGARGQMYFLRIIAPDMLAGTPEQLAEKTSKTEVWVDILDLKRGASVRLEPDKRLAGLFATPNHIYDVDLAGSIYQMQADTAGVRILKYSRPPS